MNPLFKLLSSFSGGDPNLYFNDLEVICFRKRLFDVLYRFLQFWFTRTVKNEQI